MLGYFKNFVDSIMQVYRVLIIVVALAMQAPSLHPKTNITNAAYT